MIPLQIYAWNAWPAIVKYQLLLETIKPGSHVMWQKRCGTCNNCFL